MNRRRHRTLIGSWTCPSGNSCDVFFRRGGSEIEHIEFEWDRTPLSPTDHIYYLGRILPRVHCRLAEYKEEPVAPALVITLEPSGRPS